MGIAFVGTMCSTTSSVGVTQDGGRSLSSVASTAAHELGHVFNMNHDGRTVWAAWNIIASLHPVMLACLYPGESRRMSHTSNN